MTTARATSFATLKDLHGYIKCLLDGHTESYCYNFGDNGEGAWGDITAQLHTPMVALPPAEMRARWGSTKGAHGKSVIVTLNGQGHGHSFVAVVADIGPPHVIDLNPAALAAAGLPTDTELDCAASWDWQVQPIA